MKKMTREEALKLSQEWKADTEYLLEENGCFPMNLHMPIDFIDKCQELINRDETPFEILMMNAQYALLLKLDIENVIPEDEFNVKNAKSMVAHWENVSKYKDDKDLIPVQIPTDPDEVRIVASLFKAYRQLENKDLSIEDLYLEYLKAYLETDLEALKASQEEVYEELDEDFKKQF